MNEFELIAKLSRTLPANDSLRVGSGDDCAVIDLGIPDKLVLFKTDAVVEGIHFTGEAPPEKIGYKALARCLSDIAAMGGTPNSALITLGLPKDFDPARIEKIYTGLNQLAQAHGVSVAGGETVLNPDRLLISIALIGTVAKDKCVLRSGALVRDAIFVTGELGGSLTGRHLDFEPRLEEGRWLAGHFKVHAMIDLSDGLAGDLRHILKASGVGAELLGSAIPISRSAKLPSKAESSNKPPLLAALTDGEDFELCFTVASKDAVPLLDAWKARFPHLKLSCIGKIIAGEGVTLRDERGTRTLPEHGYLHFS